MEIDPNRYRLKYFSQLDFIRLGFLDDKNNFYKSISIWLLMYILIFRNDGKCDEILMAMYTICINAENSKEIDEFIVSDTFTEHRLLSIEWRTKYKLFIDLIAIFKNGEKDVWVQFLDCLKGNEGPYMLSILEWMSKKIFWTLSSNELGGADIENMPDIALFDHYEVIRRFCRSFNLHIMIINENQETYLIGRESSKLPTIYLYRKPMYNKDFPYESYSIMVTSEIMDILESKTEISIDCSVYNEFKLSVNEQVFNFLYKINIKNNSSLILEIFSHSLKLLSKNPSFFPRYMKLAKKISIHSLFEVCYLCEKILEKSNFFINCLHHEHIKICNIHFTSNRCPYCSRNIGDREMSMFS
jgi:hypothetical protein